MERIFFLFFTGAVYDECGLCANSLQDALTEEQCCLSEYRDLLDVIRKEECEW